MGMKQPVPSRGNGQVCAHFLPVFVTVELEIQCRMVTFSARNQEHQLHCLVPQANMNFRFVKRSAESLYLFEVKGIYFPLPHFSLPRALPIHRTLHGINPRDFPKYHFSTCGGDDSDLVYKALPSTVQNSWAFEYTPKLPNPDCPFDPPSSPTRPDTHRFHVNRNS